ncbi:MAG TPA: BatA domain-containing protein [Pirellulales bacterium]|nr:BatA domain-containing protein [Pirellulales bacterium]
MPIDISFLNSAALWGLGLASIPIIIHLLFRRRFRRVDWAPMHYLKLSIQRNRRRIRLEQLLLLLLRTFAILLLFFLVARPTMHAVGLGNWLGGNSRASQILLIDDSLGMDYRDGGRSAWERVKEVAAKVIESIGPKDRFTLVLASRPGAPLVREVELENPDEIAQLVAAAHPSDAHVAWEPVFAAVDELIETGAFPIQELTLITDLRRAGWDDTVRPLGNRWAGKQLRMRIFDVGSLKTNNAALVDLKQIDRLAMIANPVRWEAVVRNDTDHELAEIDAQWSVDGKPTVVRMPAIGPGETVRVPLNSTFQEAGSHHVEFELPSDELAADNRRWGVCQAREQVQLLLVDGEPSSEPLAGEADFLGLALSLGVGDADAFQVQVVTDSEWATLPTGQPDMVALCNVAGLTPEQADKLGRWVKSGTGLMIFVGEQIDPTNYNQLLYRDGQGLLPAPLETVVDEEFSGILVEEGVPGPLDGLLQVSPTVLEPIKVRKFFQARPADDAPPGVRVLARWNSTDSAPAVLEKTFGEGTVLLWTVTADKLWSDWPTEPSYVLAVREAAKAIARADSGARALTAGEELRLPLPASERVGAAPPTVEAPEAEKPRPVRVEEDMSGGRAGGASPPVHAAPQVLVYDDTRRAGLYKLAWQAAPSTARTALFAVNPDGIESGLQRISADELRSLWGGFEPEVISAVSDGDTPIAVRGLEIWRRLAMTLLGLLVAESCFATWTGRQR